MLENSEIRQKLDKAGFEPDAFARLVPAIKTFAANNNIPDHDDFYDFKTRVESLVTPDLPRYKICSRIENKPQLLFDTYTPAPPSPKIETQLTHKIKKPKPEIKSKKGAKYLRTPSCHELFNVLAEYITEKEKLPTPERTPEIKSSHGRIKLGRINKSFAKSLITVPDWLQDTTSIKIDNVLHFMLATGLADRDFSDKQKRIRVKVNLPVPPNPFNS